jgi:starch-binding outer membrane protein, SusD/RagB family
MRRIVIATLLVAGLGGGTACSGFLTGPGIDQDPNNTTRLTRPGPLYVGIQALQSVQFEGQLARSALMYAQQIAGNGRQQIGYDRGGIAPSDIDTYFSAVYGSTRVSTGGGGLLDIRKMEQLAHRVNDSLYIGIGKVWEALVIGTAASLWGDIPYREAADSFKETPAFDPQLQVYADVIAQLDSAITVYLAAQAGGTNAGPQADGAELLYAGLSTAQLRQVYLEVAHSLKARFFMHLAEVDPANYARALAEVPLGLSTPAHDMLWFHDQSPTGQSVWWQFQANRGDIGPGAALIEVLKRRIAAGIEDEARLRFYFTVAEATNTAADFYGFRPGGASGLVTAGGIYDGSGSPAGNYSDFTFINPNTSNGDFRHPIITWAETQLIGAEAAFHAGGQAAAQPYLDAVRANRAYGSAAGTPVTFPALGPVPATLQNIMEEKYVTLFLNMEVWNDYKRTCLPALAPAASAGSTSPGTSPIPGRLPYGLTEINANPNTPTVPPTGQNANDPNACPVLDYSTSTPLGN